MSFASDNEYASLLGNDSSYSSINLNLSNKLSTNIGFATSSENDTDYIYSKLHYDLGKSYISFSLGTLMESDNFLGTESEGAFNFDGGTNTTYYGLGYVKSLANNIDFISMLFFENKNKLEKKLRNNKIYKNIFSIKIIPVILKFKD